MTTTLPATAASLTELVRTFARLSRDEDRLYTAVVTELQTARLRPAAAVPSIGHPAAASIARTGLPTVAYHRRTLHRPVDEHLFIDAGAVAGVRVLACWEQRAPRVRMQVAEVGDRGLWDRIVAQFTEWEMTGRPCARWRHLELTGSMTRCGNEAA